MTAGSTDVEDAGTRRCRRLRDWQRAGVWDRLHRAVLDRLGWPGKIDWSRAAIDSAAAPAKRGGEGTGRNHVDRGRPGVRHHVVVDRKGTPLAAKATPAMRLAQRASAVVAPVALPSWTERG